MARENLNVTLTKFVFTVPYTGYEVLTIAREDNVAGIAYDPRSTSPPTTWLGNCGLCLLGSRRVPLKVRRAVQCLATLKPTSTGGYTIKVSVGKKRTHAVRAQEHLGKWILTIRSLVRKSQKPLKVTGRDGAITSTKGRPRDYRAPVLQCCVRLLLSAREASEQEVQSILRGLPADHPPKRHEHDAPPKRHEHDAELTRLASGGTKP
jgi:hypothetical protein